MSLASRFASKYEPEPMSGCWLWTGALRGPKHKYGQYGHMRVGRKDEPHMAAHRVSWMLANDEWPDPDMVVMHKCDNTYCVNPDHLKLGTYSDNQQDAISKGRQKPPPRRKRKTSIQGGP